MRSVCGYIKQGIPAQLMGYRRRGLYGEDYPAIVPDRQYLVQGLLYTGITSAQLRAIDRYEGELYRRIQVSVAGRRAWTYVLRPRYYHRARTISLPDSENRNRNGRDLHQ